MLRGQGTATHLVVDGEPFLVRGGELGNSTASDLDDLERFWTRFRDLGLNTVLAPVYWERIEPTEGDFDFGLVDGLIRQARSHDMRWLNGDQTHQGRQIRLGSPGLSIQRVRLYRYR